MRNKIVRIRDNLLTKNLKQKFGILVFNKYNRNKNYHNKKKRKTLILENYVSFTRLILIT